MALDVNSLACLALIGSLAYSMLLSSNFPSIKHMWYGISHLMF